MTQFAILATLMIVVVAILDHAAYFTAQILGQFGVGIGNRLILTNQAAQFFGKVQQAFLGDRIGGDGGFSGARGDCCGRPQKSGKNDGKTQAADIHLLSSASSGMILLPSTSGLIGPVCFMRMTPALSMT